jgi:ATP-dependent Lon protease
MLMETGCMNPIIFLDEVDKVDVKRSLSVFNKLIEITDFSQNHEIEDYYFGGNIKLDLSKCIFIFSLNNIDNVDPILKDRLEVIKVDGFNNKDKLEIAKSYLVPSELKNYDFQVEFSDNNLRYIINKLNDEKGVRNLKRVIEIIMRKINVLRYHNQNKLSYYIKDFKIMNNKLIMNNKMIDKLLKDTGEKINPIILRMYS